MTTATKPLTRTLQETSMRMKIAELAKTCLRLFDQLAPEPYERDKEIYCLETDLLALYRIGLCRPVEGTRARLEAFHCWLQDQDGGAK